MIPYLAEHLRAVRVEEHAVLSADRADLLQRLRHAYLVVHAHHGDEAGLVGDGTLEDVQVHETVLLNRQIGHLESSLRKPTATVQNALMFLLVSLQLNAYRLCSDNVILLVFVELSDSLHRNIVALGST